MGYGARRRMMQVRNRELPCLLPLPQTSSLEGCLQITSPLEAHDPVVAQGPCVRPPLDDLALAPSATPPEGDGGDHGIPAVEEFVKLVLVRGERLTGASQGTAHFGPATASTRVGGLGGVDVFDVRGSELVEE